AGPREPAEADAHQPESPEVATALVSRERVEEWSHHARPVGADRKTWRVLTLAWTVDRERGEPATEEIVLDRVELLLHRVEAGNEDDDRRMRCSARCAQYPRDDRGLERGLDPPTGRGEAGQRLRVRGPGPLPQVVVKRAILEPEELAEVVAARGNPVG